MLARFHPARSDFTAYGNIKRVEGRDSDYIKDSNEANIHDIRTAVRRLDASYKSLPKKLGRNRIKKYMTTSKRLQRLPVGKDYL